MAAKILGWATYAVGFAIWLFGYLSAGHARLFDWKRDHALQTSAQVIPTAVMAIRLDPTDAGSLHNRGQAKLINGDTQGGNADIAAAKRLNPEVGR